MLGRAEPTQSSRVAALKYLDTSLAGPRSRKCRNAIAHRYRNNLSENIPHTNRHSGGQMLYAESQGWGRSTILFLPRLHIGSKENAFQGTFHRETSQLSPIFAKLLGRKSRKQFRRVPARRGNYASRGASSRNLRGP
jgi:hypothetical protein